MAKNKECDDGLSYRYKRKGMPGQTRRIESEQLRPGSGGRRIAVSALQLKYGFGYL